MKGKISRNNAFQFQQYSPHEIQVGAEEIYTMEETMYETEQILNEDYEKMDEVWVIQQKETN